jgi:tripartite-type tricarboxylate transporter receptor subunit TctC
MPASKNGSTGYADAVSRAATAGETAARQQCTVSSAINKSRRKLMVGAGHAATFAASAASVGSVASIALAGLTPRTARAQAYPSRPIKFIVPFPPGGGLDHTARTLQTPLQEALGQPIVIENKAGASGIVGVEFAKQQAPDGYTIFLGNTGTMCLIPSTYAKISYNPLKDFVPVGQLISNALVATVNSSLPVKTLTEFIAYAKAQGGKLSYASGGTGAITHLAGELLKAQAGFDMLHVPYKGSVPAVTDLLGGQVQFLIDVLAVTRTHIESGKLRALAATSPTRLKAMPDLPTFDETPGLKGYSATGWQGILVPAGTPGPIVARLSDAIFKVMALPDVQAKFEVVGSTATPTKPDVFAAFMKSEIEKWTGIAKRANIKVEA